jgi:hypothetical protein
MAWMKVELLLLFNPSQGDGGSFMDLTRCPLLLAEVLLVAELEKEELEKEELEIMC